MAIAQMLITKMGATPGRVSNRSRGVASHGCANGSCSPRLPSAALAPYSFENLGLLLCEWPVPTREEALRKVPLPFRRQNRLPNASRLSRPQRLVRLEGRTST
jgi:hypothetical protein